MTGAWQSFACNVEGIIEQQLKPALTRAESGSRIATESLRAEATKHASSRVDGGGAAQASADPSQPSDAQASARLDSAGTFGPAGWRPLAGLVAALDSAKEALLQLANSGRAQAQPLSTGAGGPEAANQVGTPSAPPADHLSDAGASTAAPTLRWEPLKASLATSVMASLDEAKDVLLQDPPAPPQVGPALTEPLARQAPALEQRASASARPGARTDEAGAAGWAATVARLASGLHEALAAKSAGEPKEVRPAVLGFPVQQAGGESNFTQQRVTAQCSPCCHNSCLHDQVVGPGGPGGHKVLQYLAVHKMAAWPCGQGPWPLCDFTFVREVLGWTLQVALPPPTPARTRTKWMQRWFPPWRKRKRDYVPVDFSAPLVLAPGTTPFGPEIVKVCIPSKVSACPECVPPQARLAWP